MTLKRFCGKCERELSDGVPYTNVELAGPDRAPLFYTDHCDDCAPAVVGATYNTLSMGFGSMQVHRRRG